MGEMSTHPTAVIEAGAKLGAGVKIGPYCVVGPDVTLGDGVELLSHVVVAGRTTVGARTRIFPFASIGHQPQDLKYHGEPSTLTVGSDCMIREGVTLNPGTEGGGMSTTIGNGCAFLANSHVGHDCHVGNSVIFSNNVMLAGHCTVGDFAIIGGGAAVIQYRPRRRPFVSRRHVGPGERPHSLRHGARQPGASVGPQHRRAAAARLLAQPTSTICGAPTGCCSPPKARWPSAPRTSRRNSPASPSCRKSWRSSAWAASAACARRKKRPRLEVNRNGVPNRASSASWQAAAACRARSPSTSRRTAGRCTSCRSSARAIAT